MAEEITNEEEKKGFDIKKLGVGAWVSIAVVTMVIGVLIGHFAISGGSSSAALNKTELTESELDTVVATYTTNGSTQTMTAREVIEQGSSIENAANEEGNYSIPSADTILTAVRNKIIAAAAESEGVSVTDEDITKYAEDTLGTSDLASIATSYSMDEAKVKELIKQSAEMSKLREKIVGTDSEATAPEAPTAPEAKTTDDEGNELSEEDASKAQEEANNEVKAEYAEYIIKLAGDEWDSKKGKWAAEDGPYATALADYEVTKDGASYNAANAAYYVAYQNYTTAQEELTSKWTEYVNGLLGNSSISMPTLIA